MQNKYKRIPVFDVEVGDLEKKYVKDCLDTAWLGQGSYVKNLEEKFSKFVECKFGITTTSGTTALHIFGVGIGYFSIKTSASLILLRLTGILFGIYGIYLLNLRGLLDDSMTGTGEVRIHINGSDTNIIMYYEAGNNKYQAVGSSTILNLNANDYFTFKGTSYLHISQETQFSACLLQHY